MTLENIIKRIIEANPAAIMIVEEKDDQITSSIWGRMDKEQFYDVLADAVAQHEIEKKQTFDEIRKQLPF